MVGPKRSVWADSFLRASHRVHDADQIGETTVDPKAVFVIPGDYRGEQAGASEMTRILLAGKGMECSLVHKTLRDVRVSLVQTRPEADFGHSVFVKWVGERTKGWKEQNSCTCWIQMI